MSQSRRGAVISSAFTAYERLSGAPALRSAGIHTAVSDAVGALYFDRYSISPRTIHNGVELPPEEAWPEFDRLCATRNVILAVGRLEWLKGLDTVIRAVSLLDEDARPIVAFIGEDHGDGARLATLSAENGLQDVCRFLGKQSRGRLAHAYRRATGCVVASRTEAFPAVPLEAMLAGCALISSRLPAIETYAEDGVNALMFDAGDHLTLASHLSTLCADDELRAAMEIQGRKTAARFRWEVVAHQYEALFVDAMTRSAK